ncbi:NHL repeat-containing protein [Kerstersia gyiorum]|jgi:sugar lactone lactonase YvrE|uniref:NHL repeat-containing protein n=1 Tax=Kerstersia gyiorum TaxID=206506 RepID=UPI002431361D|nr:NHL repeat-containing protein [Kerstersia gyiorum]MCH4272065.1 hypothetical protein [Kerstersia gyiorum]MCI1228482.1 hypothetical protein [Kerstersia gyiorum]
MLWKKRVRLYRWRVLIFGALLLPGLPAHAFQTFADEDRSADLLGESAHQRYQFNTPTTVTYDPDTLGSNPAEARIYVADMGNHRIQVLDLSGRSIGMLDDADTLLASDSPASSVPGIQAPLGIAFLSRSEAEDERLAGLYVNDVGRHQILFFRTVADNADTFQYVAAFGTPGSGAGDALQMPRNVVITPQGYMVVSDEFNHRIKVFRLDPDQDYQAALVQTLGWQDASGHPAGAGPIIRGTDRDYGTPSSNYDDYAAAPEKRDGFRIPQGLTYYRAPSGATYIYVADNGNNRVKIYHLDAASGQLTLLDMIGRLRDAGNAVDHLKRPRGVRTDAQGNLYIADTYNGRILRLPNLAQPGEAHAVRYRASGADDARATWVYGHLGIHQVEMRSPTTAANEDAAFQLPNDLVPLVRPDGSIQRENIWSWGMLYTNARVHLVSDSGNNRIKKCWTNDAGTSLLRCSVSRGVGTVADNEFWGYPRTLPGQLHSASGMAWLPSSQRLLVSDTPNSRINIYNAAGVYQGRFTGTDISLGVTGIGSFRDPVFGDAVAVLVGADLTLPWPYSGNSSLRIYDAGGSLRHIFNLNTRTTGLGVPAIGLGNGNYPVSVSVRPQTATGRQHAIYISSFSNLVWRFDYNASSGSLTRIWHSGGADSAKGNDLGASWSLGPAFYEQGQPGSFDQIGSVLALGDRIYVTDRRNQRIQALAPATGALIGQVGIGGGTYDHPSSLDPQRFFLPAGLAHDTARDAFLVADGFNMVARAWHNPDGVSPDGNGQISPAYLGHWLNPALGTRPGGMFDTELVTSGGDAVYVFSLISNRITRFDWSELQP